jgi:membrane protease YdiL (CAAX protease family)
MDYSSEETHDDGGIESARSAPAWPLLQFFLLAFALMWVCFFTVALAPIPAGTPLGQLLLILGAFAPSLAALLVTGRAEGGAGLRALLRGVIKWHVATRWYAFAASFTVIVKLTVAVVYRVAVGAWPRFGTDLWYMIPLAIVFSTPFQMGEEIGWRGYALPRLAARFGLARASLLLGAVWGCWHLPQFFVRDADAYRQSFWVFVIGVTSLSVVFAWLWERTGRSLLLPMLLHSAWNNSKDIVPSGIAGGTATFGFHASLVSWLTLAILWVCAACFLLDMSRRRADATVS